MDTDNKYGLIGLLLSIGSVILLFIGNIYAFITFGTEIPPSFLPVLYELRFFIIFGIGLSVSGIILSIIQNNKAHHKFATIGIIIGTIMTAIYVISVIAYFILG